MENGGKREKRDSDQPKDRERGQILLTLSNELMMVIQLFFQLFVSVIFLVNMYSVSFVTFVL